MVGGQRPFLHSHRPRSRNRGTGSSAERGQSGRWADVYATLIAAGYGDAERIGKLTERQILLYYEAEQRRQRRARAEFLKDANLAFAGGKEAEQHLKALLK
ncbi:hypothetical protein CDR19_25505 [Ectopseudomonas toyotomiensis]|nr:hypothetical protein CDR19_25505 [Pseudomonas toyotomiensis]